MCPRNVFLDSLRQYNKEHPGKEVSVLGMDFNRHTSPNQNTLMDIFDFLTSLPDWQLKKSIYPLLRQLLEGKGASAYQTFTAQERTLRQWIGTLPTQCLLRSLGFFNELPKDPTRIPLRDSIMARNVMWVRQMDKSEILPVIAHAEHVSRSTTQSFSLCRPMGSYLHEAYGERYRPLMLTFGKGNAFVTAKKMEITTFDSDTPPAGSVEMAGMSLPDTENCWILPAASLPDTLQYGRFMGGGYTKHSFYPMNVRTRFDAVLFFHTAMGKPMSFSIEEGYQLFLQKMRRREAAYAKIKDK